MHHYIHHAARSLIRRQAESALGVHDGEARTAQVIVVGTLYIAVFICYHTAIAHLTAGCRKGEHYTNREPSLGPSFAGIEIPHITGVCHTHGNCLGGIDNTTTAHSKNEINVLTLGQVNALAYLRKARIRHYPTQFYKFNAIIGKHCAYRWQQPRLFCTLTTIVEQHTTPSMTLYERRNVLLALRTEYNFGRGVIMKISHNAICFYAAKLGIFSKTDIFSTFQSLLHTIPDFAYLCHLILNWR